MKREHRRRTVHYNPHSSAVAFFWCRVLKRLDRFHLLSVRSRRPPSPGLRGHAPPTVTRRRGHGRQPPTSCQCATRRPSRRCDRCGIPGAVATVRHRRLHSATRWARSFMAHERKRKVHDPERGPRRLSARAEATIPITPPSTSTFMTSMDQATSTRNGCSARFQPAFSALHSRRSRASSPASVPRRSSSSEEARHQTCARPCGGAAKRPGPASDVFCSGVGHR